MQLRSGEPTQLGERRYRPLLLAGVQLVELIDSSPGAVAINRQLRAELATSAAGDGALRDKVRSAVRSLGSVALDRISARVIEWSDQWLTLELNREFSGEGAAGADNGYRSWDMRSGREVDPWTWFDLKSRESLEEPLVVARIAKMPDALKNAVLQAATNVKACQDVYRGPLFTRIWAHTMGIEFTIGDTRNPECLQSVNLPFATVRPLMTPKGREDSRRIFGS